MKFTIGKQPYGSKPWYAVLTGQEVHPTNAAYFDSGIYELETSFGKVSTDGMIRFFNRKRDLVEMIKGRIS